MKRFSMKVEEDTEGLSNYAVMDITFKYEGEVSNKERHFPDLQI